MNNPLFTIWLEGNSEWIYLMDLLKNHNFTFNIDNYKKEINFILPTNDKYFKIVQISQGLHHIIMENVDTVYIIYDTGDKGHEQHFIDTKITGKRNEINVIGIPTNGKWEDFLANHFRDYDGSNSFRFLVKKDLNPGKKNITLTQIKKKGGNISNIDSDKYSIIKYLKQK